MEEDRVRLIMNVKNKILEYEKAVDNLITANNKLIKALDELAKDVRERLLDHGYNVDDVYVIEDDRFPKPYIVIAIDYEASELEKDRVLTLVKLLLYNYYGETFMPYFLIKID